MAKVKSYVNGQKWEFPAYIDPNQDLKRALNFQSIPFAIIFDKDGKIAYTHSGYVEGDEFVLRDHIKEIMGAK
jgi:thioredoxin-related protein